MTTTGVRLDIPPIPALKFQGGQVTVRWGLDAVPIAVGRSLAKIQEIETQAANARARRAARLISQEECRRRLHRLGEAIAFHKRLVARYRRLV